MPMTPALQIRTLALLFVAVRIVLAASRTLANEVLSILMKETRPGSRSSCTAGVMFSASREVK